MAAAVVGKMLKNPVTQGSISRVLLNLTKRLMFVMFQRLLVRLNVHAVNIYIFSLVHQLRLLLILNFVPLHYLFGW